MSQSTAKRRRRQAVNGYRHMAPLIRPKYSRTDAATAQRKEAIAKTRRARLIAAGVKV